MKSLKNNQVYDSERGKKKEEEPSTDRVQVAFGGGCLTASGGQTKSCGNYQGGIVYSYRGIDHAIQ